ncbi:MAG: hypothetical protein ACOYI5_08075 [Christensenellales bacterium]
MEIIGGLIYTLVAMAALSSAAELVSPKSDAGQGARLIVGLLAVLSVLAMLAAVLELMG